MDHKDEDVQEVRRVHPFDAGELNVPQPRGDLEKPPGHAFDADQEWLGIFNSVDDMITIHDADFNIILANDAAQQSLDLSGNKCFRSFHGMDAPPQGCPSCEVRKTYKPVRHEMFSPHLGRHIAVTAIPRHDRTGGFCGVVHIVRDITTQKLGEARREEEKRRLEELVARRTSQLQETLRQLEDQVKTDQLTNTFNRRWFEEAVVQEMERARRHDRPVSVGMFDIDRFKEINDTHGHDVGDVVLKGVSRAAQDALRVTDALIRWGGDEFVLLLPETALPEAQRVADRLRGEIAGERFAGFRVTISLGATTYRDGDTPHQMLRRADVALYLAKNQGRNQVVTS